MEKNPSTSNRKCCDIVWFGAPVLCLKCFREFFPVIHFVLLSENVILKFSFQFRNSDSSLTPISNAASLAFGNGNDTTINSKASVVSSALGVTNSGNNSKPFTDSSMNASLQVSFILLFGLISF